MTINNKTLASQMRIAANRARYCDDMLDKMNKTRDPKERLSGFDLDFLADEFESCAAELDSKPDESPAERSESSEPQ